MYNPLAGSSYTSYHILDLTVFLTFLSLLFTSLQYSNIKTLKKKEVLKHHIKDCFKSLLNIGLRCLKGEYVKLKSPFMIFADLNIF